MFKNLLPWLSALAAAVSFQYLLASELDPYYLAIILLAGINIILATSLNLVNGFTGQFSIGHAGFMAIGAYFSALLSLYFRSQFPEAYQDHTLWESAFFFIALIAGGSLASLMGLVVGLPSLRLKGDYLAIVTLGFGEIIRVMILNIDSIGGARGLPDIPGTTNFGWIYAFVVLTLFVLTRVIRSPQGRGLLAVREDEIAAEAMGVSTTGVKVRAFVLGAFFAGIAGGLFAHQIRYLNPASFDFNRSFEIIIMVVLGGMGSITGSVVSAIFLTVLREALRPLQEITKIDFRMVIYSLSLIVLMLTRPNGLFGTSEISDILQRFRKSSRSKTQTPEANS